MAKYPKQIEKNIEQRGKSSFRVCMMSEGRRITCTFDTLTDAQTYRDLMRANKALDENESRIFESRTKKAESKSFTFAQAVEKYRKEKSEKKKGWRQEAASLNKIARWPNAKLPLYQFKADHVLELLEWLKTSGRYVKAKDTKTERGVRVLKKTVATDATARRYFNLVRHIFQIAVDEWKKIDSNPCDSIPKSARPKDGKGRDRRLRGDEYPLMLGQLHGQARVLFVLAIETTMRRGDQLAARWENLDLKRGTLLLPDGKGGEARTVYLSDVAIAAFKNLTQGIKGKIFSITPGQLRYQWSKAREAIGSPDLRLHDLRHEGTSRLFEKGFGDIEAATQTGHKSLQMLKKYAHLKQSHILEKLNRQSS